MSRGPRSSVHYGGKSTKVKLNFEPGIDYSSLSYSVGGCLASDPSFINAITHSFTGTEIISGEGNFESVTSNILSCSSGEIKRLTANNYCIFYWSYKFCSFQRIIN